MSQQRRIRVIGKPRKDPDLKALARAVIELALTLDNTNNKTKDAELPKKESARRPSVSLFPAQQTLRRSPLRHEAWSLWLGVHTDCSHRAECSVWRCGQTRLGSATS